MAVGFVSVGTRSMELYTATRTDIALTTTPANYTIGTIVLPTSLSGTIQAAYIDLYVTGVRRNTYAGTNNTYGNTYVRVDNTAGGGAAYTNACLIPDSSGTQTASSIESGLQYFGAIDIKAKCTTGTTLTIQWYQGRSTNNDLSWYDVVARLRLVIG